MTISSLWVQQRPAAGAAAHDRQDGVAWGPGADAAAAGGYDDDDAGGYGGYEGGFGGGDDDSGDAWADDGGEGAGQGKGEAQGAAAIQLLQAPRRVAKTGVTYSRAAKQVCCLTLICAWGLCLESFAASVQKHS